MCLILVAHQVREDTPLVLAANRDESYARPTAPARFRGPGEELLAGQDLVAGGTWLGVTRSGRIAAVTNIREPMKHRPDARTRGELPAGFLGSGAGPRAFLERLEEHRDAYNGYNLLVGVPGRLWYASNRDPRGPLELEPGFHGLSNSILSEPWPKVRSGLDDMRSVLAGERLKIEDLFTVLGSESRALDENLPDTGVGLERERVLSSRFIRSPEYGTRSSTVVLFSADGHVSFVERTWSPRGGLPETRAFRFRHASQPTDVIHAD